MPKTPKAAAPSDHVPKPPDPSARRKPLPTDKPKPSDEDPSAPRRLQAILASPTYRRPDADPDFLSRDDVRGVRLMLDYLKPELILEQSVVKHTVVVFGSTRIMEKAGAERDLEAAKAAQARDPDNPALTRQLKSAERVLAKSRYYD